MIEFLSNMVMLGKITIDQVPDNYRQEVREHLSAFE